MNPKINSCIVFFNKGFDYIIKSQKFLSVDVFIINKFDKPTFIFIYSF